MEISINQKVTVYLRDCHLVCLPCGPDTPPSYWYLRYRSKNSIVRCMAVLK